MTDPMDELRQASADLQQMENPTPPPELVQQWRRTAPHPSNEREHYHFIATRAAQWGADNELKACLDQMSRWGLEGVENLRNTRRPKPPNLAEEALAELGSIATAFRVGYGGDLVCDTIRRALERLQELEEQQ